MILNIFAIHDSKAEAYMTPFFMRNNGEALRGFMDSMENSESPFHKWPQDYTLFWIGVYDDETGIIEHRTPKSLGNGVELRRSSSLNRTGEKPNGADGPSVQQGSSR